MFAPSKKTEVIPGTQFLFLQWSSVVSLGSKTPLLHHLCCGKFLVWEKLDLPLDQKNQTEKPKPKGRNHSLPPPIAKFSRQTEAQLRLRFTSKDQDGIRWYGVGCFQV